MHLHDPSGPSVCATPEVSVFTRSRRRAMISLGLSAVLALTGCAAPAGSPSSTPPDATGSIGPTLTASPVTVVSPSPNATASPSEAAAFPVTLTDDDGTSVPLDAEPQHIVSLTPANTEILFELGAGERVVATDESSDYPADAASLPRVTSFGAAGFTIDVEQIVALDADLVVAGGNGGTPPDAIAQLRDLDIPVLVVYAPSIEGVYHDIQLIGQATGEGAAATTLTTEMRAEIDAIQAAVTGSGTRPRTYYEVGYTDTTGQIFAPANQSFLAEMITAAGGDVITTGDPVSYEIPLEKLIKADPELILLGVNPFYTPTPEAVKGRPGWKVMTAVKNDAIRIVQDTEITRPGPRLPIGLRNLAAAIRPDVTLPVAP